MIPTLQDLVFNQIIMEGPQIEDEAQRDQYVMETLNAMTNCELLTRISDALRTDL
jgi:hypothetical protein